MKKLSPHKLPEDIVLKNVLETDIGTVFFYGNIVVFEAKEGIVLSYKNGFSILLKGLKILGAKPWVYISNRVNSYSIKPIDYKYLNKNTNVESRCHCKLYGCRFFKCTVGSKILQKAF